MCDPSFDRRSLLLKEVFLFLKSAQWLKSYDPPKVGVSKNGQKSMVFRHIFAHNIFLRGFVKKVGDWGCAPDTTLHYVYIRYSGPFQKWVVLFFK